MACDHPLLAWRDHLDFKTIHFCNLEQDRVKWSVLPEERRLKIPCGQCAVCRLTYSRHWAVRCVLESQQWEHNYFLTLTYDQEHVPVLPHAIVDFGTGEVVDLESVMILVPDDLKKFMKDLRERYSRRFDHDNIRFFACGEYGDKRHRPHYHLIVFNLPILDLKPLSVKSKSECGSLLYESKIISDVWKKGIVCIGDLTFQSAAYTARYIMKKHKGRDRDYYANHGLVPEFTRMSRMPGLAREYYDKNRDKIYTYDKIVIAGRDGKPITCKPPNYYDRLYDVDCYDDMQNIKSERKRLGQLSMENKLKNTSLSEEEYLCVVENNRLNSIKLLTRSLE